MGRLGKFWFDSFNESDRSLEEHFLSSKEKTESFRIYRIITEEDTDYESALKSIDSASFDLDAYGGITIQFLAYEPRIMKHPRIVTFKRDFYEIDIDRKIIKNSDRHFGRSFGQDAIAEYYYIGTEKEFFEELGYRIA